MNLKADTSSLPTDSKAGLFISTAAALYAIVGGLLSLAGWMAEVPRLIDWWGTGVTIKANTAIAVIVGGLALLCLIYWPSRVLVRTLGAFVALVGALTLSQHILGWDLGIDTLLFDEPAGAAGTAAPGRMGPPASSSFVAIGSALVLLTSERVRLASVWLALLVVGIGILSLIGYWYGAEAMYSVPRLTGIALQTATFVVALGVGIIASQRDLEPMKTLSEDSYAGVLARSLVPAALIVPLALGWLRVEGQRASLYDYAFGTALRTIVEVAILAGVLWWSVQAIRTREIRQRRAEAARQSTEQRMRSVLDSSAVPFAILAPIKDSAGLVVDFSWAYVNAAAAAVLRLDAGQLIGRCITAVPPHTWDDPSLFDNYVAVATRNEVREFEFRSAANGTESWFHVIASALQGDVAVWFTDVTERKRQELELRSADRRKDEFLATLAHELRNPLAPVRQAAMLASKPTITHSQRQWCNEVIERQVQHMSLLLDDLLDVSRITRGTLPLRKRPSSLSGLIDSAVETVRPLIDSKQHRLELHLPEEPVILDVDPLRLSQVISNLLNNAAKYTNAGGTIQLQAELREADLALSVTDNGIGIAREELTAIFAMFSQSKSAQERSEGGLGIGLALTKGLVELHGGTIAAYSDGPGTGSRFTLIIPKAVLARGVVPPDGPSEINPVGRHRILIADDNRDAATSLAMLLEIDGHEVALAQDGEEALAKLREWRADVALLDIGMPRLNGYEVARRVRAQDADILLVAITGWGQSADRAKSQHAGFDHHLTKPVEYRQLTEILSTRARTPISASRS